MLLLYEVFGLDGSTRNSRILIILLTILLVVIFPIMLAILVLWTALTTIFSIFWHLFIEPIRWIIVGGNYGDGYSLLLKTYNLLKVPG